MLEIYCLNTRILTPQAYKKACASLSKTRINRANALAFEGDRLLSVGAGYLLSHALSLHGVSEAQATYAYGKYGKPYLVGCNLKFSLSHSGNVAVCALSNEEVGVDVQLVKSPSAALVKRACTQAEQSLLASLGGGEQSDCFTRIWTAKESYIKYLGEGLSLSLNSLGVEFSPLRVIADGVPTPLNFFWYGLGDYSLTLCTPQAGKPVLQKIDSI